jgi:hypothetical protein
MKSKVVAALGAYVVLVGSSLWVRADGGVEISPSLQEGYLMSLVYEEGTDTERDPKAVSFPVRKDQGQEESWLLWKASAGAPILALDPNRTGKVVTAEQIIGTWAFGGKSEGEGSRRPWKDAYEALSYLDDDLDGKLTGMELRGLGLWFDRNRNGICDAGEYSPVGLKGITIIYLGYQNEDARTGRKWSTRGFQYVNKDGVAFTGWTVSWRTKVAKEEKSILDMIKALPKPCPKGNAGDVGSCQDESSPQTLGSIETQYR